MKHIVKQNPDYSDYNIENEKSNLKKFSDENGLYIPDKFYDNIRQGDVIDIYTAPPEFKQLYGNSQFKSLCSYTEKQMAEIPFPKLFYRTDDVQLALLKTMTDVVLNSDTAVKYNFAHHDLVESLNPNKRTFEIDLGWIAPCFRKGSNERIAFVNSLKVEFIFEWVET